MLTRRIQRSILIRRLFHKVGCKYCKYFGRTSVANILFIDPKEDAREQSRKNSGIPNFPSGDIMSEGFATIRICIHKECFRNKKRVQGQAQLNREQNCKHFFPRIRSVWRYLCL